MKRLLIFCLLLLTGCSSHSKEEVLIIDYMKAHANDPASYEPLSFHFAGPATNDNMGLIKGDSARQGDLYEHTYRAKNAFGALMMHTTVFAIESGQLVTPLEDSLAEKLHIHP